MWNVATDMTKYTTDVYVNDLTSQHVRMQVVIVRDVYAWALTLGSIGCREAPGGPGMAFLAGCDAEYLARKMERPQHEVDWDAVSKALGFEVDITTARQFEDSLSEQYGEHWHESLPQKETARFRCAKAAAQAVIDDANLRTF